uniref:3D domain-containing protein n=1 Tax=Enterocloster aldenensis TaxID=358742 RepID=UPI0036F19B0F
MTDNNHGYRMTEFRKSCQRHNMVRKFLRLFLFGCSLMILAAGFSLAQFHTAGAEQTQGDQAGTGAIDNPYPVEVLDLNPSQPASQPTSHAVAQPVSRPGFAYLGEFEVAAYSSDGKDMTYSGEAPVKGHTAAGALSVFKIGDTVLIDGDSYVIEDKVDEDAREKLRIYFDSYEEAKQYGRKKCLVYRHSEEPLEGANYLGEFQVTGYCSCFVCCGEKEEKLTKSETVPKAAHTIAADPSVIPLGTRIVIDDVTYTAEDTGKAIKGMQLDIYFDTHEEAVRYGRKEKYVYLKE